MNTKFIATVGILMAMWLMPPINAIAATDLPISACSDSSQCVRSAMLNCHEYCCKTGLTGTKKTCPDGWTVNAAGTCRRSSVSGSDSKGWYTQNYGTCDATVTTYDCYIPSDSSTYNGKECGMVRLPIACYS